MSERLPQTSNPFSSTVSTLMIGFGTLAFIAIFVLLAWSPDLANKDRAAQHPYSSSALGYAGLVTLLEADGQTVTISRLASTRDSSDGLLVFTIPSYGLARIDDFDLENVSEPALYVLPKWTGRVDPAKPNWQEDTDLLDKSIATSIARLFDSDLKVWRVRDPGTIPSPFGPTTPRFEQEMQVIESDSLNVVVDTPGGALVSKVPGRSIYILSDPDLLNTFGLSNRENARFALGLFDWIKDYSDQGVTFDATLHGFERSESLLRAIFDVPFLGATMIGFMTMLLLGWSAFVRFGPHLKEERAITFGKKALAESSAGLISMARREGQMAPAYRQVIQRNLAKRLGLPTQLPDEVFARTADRLAKQKDLARTWSEESQNLAEAAATRTELRDQALALWRWREEIKDED
ncbi:MAG: DUF4350 domain-containing protein [Pseudomonadota bacterium]